MRNFEDSDSPYRIPAFGKLCAGLLMAAGALALSAGVAGAATITVNIGADEFNPGPGTGCSLREAIQSANIDNDFGDCVGAGAFGNDTIVFAPGVSVIGLTITTPGANNDDNSFLDLDIGDSNMTFPNNLTIDGGPNGVVVQPGVPIWGDRIFDIPQIAMGQPGAVVLRNLTIQGGNAPTSETGGGQPCFNSGGGVRNWSGGPLTLENVTVQNNAMPMHGGGVCQRGSTLTVLTSTVSNNTANMMGGGIYAINGFNLTVVDSTIRDNTAGRAGGGIGEGNDAFTLQNSQVLSNTVILPGSVGGGVATYGGTTLKSIVTSTVAYNRADGDGGGIYNQTTRGLQVNASTVLSNTAGAFLNNPGNGGGIWSSTALFLNNTAVLNNAALISGTAMSVVPGGGGGIYHKNAWMNIFGGQVSNNLARRFVGGDIAGGGIWNGGIATLDGVEVRDNIADGAAPGIMAYGGGLFNVARLTVQNNSRVDYNRAEGVRASGGGIYNSDMVNSTGARLTLQSSSVSTNTAQGNPVFGGGEGGGIFNGSFSGDTADIMFGQIRNNRADGGQGAQGGGVRSGNVLTLTSSLVVSNTATAANALSAGGGVHSAGQSAWITDTQILTNVAQQGGGWFNFNTPQAEISNSQVRFNRAVTGPVTGSGNGGGIYHIVSGLQIWDSMVCQNQADQDGGGVYNSGSSFMMLMASTVCANAAGAGGAGNGGGMYNLGFVNIMNSQVLTNTAPNDGGGIFNAGFVGIGDSAFSANTASNGNGGGVYNTGSMGVGQSTFSANSASNGNGGGAFNDATAILFSISNSTFQGNSAIDGGGLYNAGPANVYYSALIANTASGNGGGSYNSGTLESLNNTFSGNSAPVGGGLYAAVGGTAYLTHTTVASNTNGAGIAAVTGTVEVLATLLAYNAGSNCTAALTENGTSMLGASMSSDNTCAVTTLNTDPLLQPLALNGGTTLNHALSPGSPALDAAGGCNSYSVFNDQRFVSRPQGTACDIGAFELEEADLEVSKSADPSPVIAGQTITYTVIVTNTSFVGAANNVVLTDTLSGGATFGGVVSSGGFVLQSSTPSQAIFTLSSLTATYSVTLVFTATAPASGPITNTAVVASDNPDPVPSNNTASVTTPVTPAAYLLVSKAQDYAPHAPGVVLPGGMVTYTIVVTNNGPSTAQFILVQDMLQPGVTYVGHSVSAGNCTYSAPILNCNTLPTPIPAGGSVTVLITVTAPITSNTVFTNAALAGAPAAYPYTAFGSNVATLTTAAQAELRTFKTATPSPVLAGQPVTYVVTVQNFGPDPANNVVITDVFQGGATFGSVVGTSGGATLQSSSAGGVTFTVASLGFGASASMTYTVIAPASGVITNTATAASDAVDPTPNNNVFSTTTPVTPVATLQIGKAQSVVTPITGTVRPGGTITYTLLVTNAGPSSATSITVTDSLPAGLTYVSAGGSGWSCSFSAPTVTCTTPTLSVGAAPAIQIVATAPVTPGLVLTNTATVNAATYPNTPATSNSVVVKVQYRVFAPIVRKP